MSSLLFGWLHQCWLAGMLAGLGFAYAQYRNRHLLYAVVAHATANTIIYAAVLAIGSFGSGIGKIGLLIREI